MGRIGSKVYNLINLFKSEKKVPIIQTVPESELLKGKTALITGGSGGIGMAIARQFLDAGANVIITGTNSEKLEKCVKELGGEKIKSMLLNVAKVSSFEAKVNEASLFFDGMIDILVNCAGVITKSHFFEMNEDEYDRVMDINAKGTFFMCQAVSKLMIAKKIKGHILNLSSASAVRPASSPYHMSKWAIRGLTIGLADILLPEGIVVNAIGPGPTATSMLGKDDDKAIYHGTNPSKRYALPEEIAALALFMVSGKGDMIVGDTFYITGGGGITSLHN
ncbi:MAG: SDR family oxidoreductase [Ruminococcus sp.]|nr:SDR family oxidoreductase [Ruminococcus sp.]